MTKMKRNKGYSRAKQAKTEAAIRELIGKNCTDDEIMDALHLQPHVLRHYRDRINRFDRFVIDNMDADSILLEYGQFAKQCAGELEEAMRVMRKRRTPPLALVQAIRLRHRIENQVIDHARNMGKMPKRADTLELREGLMFRKHTMKEIREAVELDAENMLRDLEA